MSEPLSSRFKMGPRFERSRGASAFQQSNPDILSLASLKGSLQVFKDAGGVERGDAVCEEGAKEKAVCDFDACV